MEKVINVHFMTAGNLTNTNHLDYQAGVITCYLVAGPLCAFGVIFIESFVLCLLIYVDSTLLPY